MSSREGHTWFVISWRTLLKPGGHNRRFYLTGGDAWTLDARTALDMLTKLEELGALDERYYDRDRRPDFKVITSDDVNTVERESRSTT